MRKPITILLTCTLAALIACNSNPAQPETQSSSSSKTGWYSDASYQPIASNPKLRAQATSDRFNSPTNLFSSDWARSNLEVISKPITEGGVSKTVWQMVADPTTTGTISAPITASSWAYNQRMTVSALFYTSKVGGATVQLALRDIVHNADFVDLTTPKAPNPVNCVIPASTATRCFVTLVSDDGSAGAFQIRGIPNDVSVFAGDVIATNNTTGVTGSALIANPTDFSQANWTRTNIQLYARQPVAAGPILFQLRGNAATAGNTATLFKTAVGEAAQITASIKLIADRPVSTITLTVRQKLVPANVYATVTVPSFSTTQVTASITVNKPNDGLAAEFVIGGVPQNTTVWAGDAQEVSSTPLGGPVTSTYTPSTADMKNPERGFKYTQIVYFNPATSTFEKGSYNGTTVLTYGGEASMGTNITDLVNDIQSQNNVAGSNRTVIQYNYSLEGLTTAIPPTALTRISTDLSEARAKGFKVLPIFSYCFYVGFIAPGGTAPNCSEPPVATILSHIDQLAPILTSNADVIAFFKTGMVGRWGEWNGSNRFPNIQFINNSTQTQPTTAVIADAKSVIDRWLLKLPTTMFVANRLQAYKRDTRMYGLNSALTSAEGFSGSNKARLAHFNDCYNANNANAGTYGNISGDNSLIFVSNSTNPVVQAQYPVLEEQKTYLNTENQYLPQSGEECYFITDPPPYNAIQVNGLPLSPPARPTYCDSALADFKRMRWSIFEGSNAGLGQIKVDGSYPGETSCVSQIRNALGYRLRVSESTIPSSVQRGTAFNMSFKVVNDGWASPYNQRKLEVILRNGTTVHRIPVAATSSGLTSSDPRRWLPGQTYTVSVTGTLPASLVTGAYDVLLNLPDPNATLANSVNNPKYAIRLAALRSGGSEVWEASTGFNLLAPAAVNVTP
jgi:Domain of unknown function (DUF4832)/Domain of unknown function (DUF4874)